MKEMAIKAFDANQERILTRMKEVFNLSSAEPRRLGSFESIVYEAVRNDRPVILRITDSDHRELNEIYGELEWINYLAEGGISVSRALPSQSGNLVETVDIERPGSDERFYFSLAVFEKSEGRLLRFEDWNRELFVTWGRTIGRIHALSVKYRPSRLETRRPHWYEDKDIEAYKVLPEDQGEVVDQWQELLSRMRKFPTGDDTYGLIHDDIHHGNIFVNNGSITVFDFDDCRYHWYVSDLAISLFYLIQDINSGNDKETFARQTLGYLLEGYYSEFDLPRSELERIGDLLKFREIMLYLIMYDEKAFDLNDWCRRYMVGRRDKIENNIPFVDIDFGGL